VRRLAVALALVAASAGCALLQPEGESARLVGEIVDQTVAATGGLPEDQRRLVAEARRSYDAMPDEANGVRYAALLATLPAPLRDEARAATILGPIAAQKPETAMTRFAALLSISLAERRRLAQEARAAEQRAQAASQRADAASQRAEAATTRAEAAERREEGANERASKLQGQVEALKSIERSILQREERRRNVKR
jgi:hypothetical protein